MNKQKLLMMNAQLRSIIEEMSVDLNSMTSAQISNGGKMTFETCLPMILKWEGGYVNNPNDPGGETNYGISKRAYPDLDIKNLTLDQAKEIYKKHYWDAGHLNQVPSVLRLSYFDACVNMGPAQATKCLQAALGIMADGIFGAQTMAALAKADDEIVYKFLVQRMQFYISLSTWSVFGCGWANRVLDVAIESGRGLQ